ncbi:MAG TPA: siderophore-interacting protein [Parvibaculum sp.]|jgi:NADPH-dependent ferric siderophore reductase
MLKEPGFVEARLLKWLTRAATVAAIEDLSPRFRLVDLEGEALKDHVWAAGQKTQVQLGGFVSRTYTPMSWDNDKGATRFLAYIHGDAPASRWASALAIGDEVLMFGPRGSLDLSSAQKPLLLFGDETSFGLAHSAAASGVGDTAFLFEVTSAAESEKILAALGIANAVLVERKANDAHMDEVERELMQVTEARKPAQFVLTGKSLSIQRLSRALKARGLTSAQIKSKAYWAPGKTGLD